MTLSSSRTVTSNKTTIEECIFRSFPFSSAMGGAILIQSSNACVLRYLVFDSCSASQGGAVAIESSNVVLFSVCLSSCSAREQSDNGGNAVYTMSCSIFGEHISSYMCAPDSVTCGDSVFQIRDSFIYAVSYNFSTCRGMSGECSFGCKEVNDSLVKFTNIVDCYEHNMYYLPGSTLKYSNIIRCEGYSYFINDLHGPVLIEDSYFFGNVDNGDTQTPPNVVYLRCFGDIVRSGVTLTSNTITYPLSRVMNNECLLKVCSYAEETKLSTLFLVSIICFIKL